MVAAVIRSQLGEYGKRIPDTVPVATPFESFIDGEVKRRAKRWTIMSMKQGAPMKRTLIESIVILAVLWSLPSTAMAQQPLIVKPLAENIVAELPAGPLFWRIENFDTLAQARGAAGRWSLVAGAAGKVWLFTLGPAGGSSIGGTKVAEVGPIARIVASQYLLRINEATGSPGSITPVHTHPGSEAYFVLAGEQSIRGARGVMRVASGHAEAGQGADTPMEVSSSGSADLDSLVMFVVDATKSFSSPASIP